MGTRRTPEFRAEAVHIALSSGLTQQQVGGETGIRSLGTRKSTTVFETVK